MRKRWHAYRQYLRAGDWHVHSSWSSDGTDSISECCRAAESLGLRLIAFTEHVRREMHYDYTAFRREVEQARSHFNLVVLAGCEAKVLDLDGTLDAPADVLAQADLVIGSFHSFPAPQHYVDAVIGLLGNPLVDVWGHPLLYARRRGIRLSLDALECIIDTARAQDVLVEVNARHRVPGPQVEELLRSRDAPWVCGSDAHRAADVGGRNGMPAGVQP